MNPRADENGTTRKSLPRLGFVPHALRAMKAVIKIEVEAGKIRDKKGKMTALRS
jgi:hypothetical protein